VEVKIPGGAISDAGASPPDGDVIHSRSARNRRWNHPAIGGEMNADRRIGVRRSRRAEA